MPPRLPTPEELENIELKLNQKRSDSRTVSSTSLEELGGWATTTDYAPSHWVFSETYQAGARYAVQVHTEMQVPRRVRRWSGRLGSVLGYFSPGANEIGQNDDPNLAVQSPAAVDWHEMLHWMLDTPARYMEAPSGMSEHEKEVRERTAAVTGDTTQLAYHPPIRSDIRFRPRVLDQQGVPPPKNYAVLPRHRYSIQ